jgi:pSer/pThr/pTyr-binding forkhead associated (FHA) protein
MLSSARKLKDRNTSFLGDPQRPVMQERSIPRTGLLAPPWRLLMQIGGDSQTTVGMEVRDQIVVGRADPLAEYLPDLDLSPYGGQQNGVSRKHIIISQADKALYVQDLGTTNGTRINGFQLDSNQFYRLRDGDELELGRIRITVRFVRSPY